MELWMGGFAAAILIRAKRVPFLVRHQVREAQSGQDHEAFRHPRDPPEQRSDRGSGRGDPRRDGKSRRRTGFPALSNPPQQAVATLGEVDRAALGEDSWPFLVDQLQLLERNLPMPGELVGLRDRIP